MNGRIRLRSPDFRIGFFIIMGRLQVLWLILSAIVILRIILRIIFICYRYLFQNQYSLFTAVLAFFHRSPRLFSCSVSAAYDRLSPLTHTWRCSDKLRKPKLCSPEQRKSRLVWAPGNNDRICLYNIDNWLLPHYIKNPGREYGEASERLRSPDFRLRFFIIIDRFCF